MSIAVTPDSYELPEAHDDTRERLRRMATEIRAEELVFALACAVAGAPNWRQEAKQLLSEIAEGIVPEPQE
jgi:hypothetical protein